jgi:TorA maturation chaperone TorD
MMTSDEHQSLANVYALLGQIWLSEIDADTLRSIAAAPLNDAFGIDPDVVANEESLESLAVEYCALFIGPKDHFPPYQSVWQTGQLQSETAASVREFAEAIDAGDLIDEASMADHVGHQLCVMGCIHAMLSEDKSDALAQLGNAFFQRHLSWIQPLAQSVSRRSGLKLYRSMATLTADLVASEQAFWAS